MVTGFAKCGWRAAALVCVVSAVLVGCSGDGDPPKGFGVNVTVDARNIPQAERDRIVSGRMLASSGKPTEVSLDSAIRSGEVRFRFIPQATTGGLVLALEALDAVGAVVASGVGTAVELLPDRAVATTITLMPGPLPSTGDGGVFDFDAPVGKANGVACTTNAECASNACADGVCCNVACSGTCESCALAGLAGTCSPIPDDTDPELECAPVIPMAPEGDAGAGSDAGPVDGGLELNVPEGGLMRNAAVCGGKCNGQRACKFPGPSTSCGTKWCNEVTEPAAMVCNGAGSCEPQLSQCNDYACNEGACRTQCAKHEDCQTETNYCAGDNTCKPKKANGITCTVAAECGSGFCAGNVCCNASCETPLNCTDVAGSCRCPGLMNCPTGVSCQLFYQDADGDGFGDAFGTTANGAAKAACANQPPAGFVANNRDCDDGDANVRPGQTAFFKVASKGKNTYDYNCDGALTKELPEGSLACNFQYGDECGKDAPTTCRNANDRAGNDCFISCFRPISPIVFSSLASNILIPSSCWATPRDAFTRAVACGGTGLFRTCGTCLLKGGLPSKKDENRVQGCR